MLQPEHKGHNHRTVSAVTKTNQRRTINTKQYCSYQVRLFHVNLQLVLAGGRVDPIIVPEILSNEAGDWLAKAE